MSYVGNYNPIFGIVNIFLPNIDKENFYSIISIESEVFIMKDRLKELRKSLGLTQQEFADRLHIKRTNIGNYEVGVSLPTDSVIALICREFNVSEAWLRNGEGEMFIPMTLDEEIASFIGGIQADIEPTFQKRFISALAKLSPEEWKTIEHIMRNMIDERENEEEKE